MKRHFMVCAIAFILFISFVQNSQADWPITRYPELRGIIIDAETKEPIEGAVAVVYYMRDMLIGGPGGPGYYILHAKECLTDKKGEFYFPSYTSFHLISEGGSSNFIFFKPGYMAISENVYTIGDTGIRVSMEEYLSTGTVGEEVEIKNASRGSAGVSWKGPAGILALKKAKTREEKWKAPLVFTSSLEARDLPLLYKSIDVAEKNLRAEGIK